MVNSLISTELKKMVVEYSYKSFLSKKVGFTLLSFKIHDCFLCPTDKDIMKEIENKTGRCPVDVIDWSFI